jgi:hypothetical protein
MKVQNKDGSPSAYGFACGYEMGAHSEEKRVQLFKEPGCQVFQLKIIDWEKRIEGQTDWNNSNGFRVWHSFDNLRQAKQEFYKACVALQLIPNHRDSK